MKKQEKKLMLKKLTISKLNNMTTINGGNMDSIVGPTDGPCVTKKTFTELSLFDCPPTTIIDCPSNHLNC